MLAVFDKCRAQTAMESSKPLRHAASMQPIDAACDMNAACSQICERGLGCDVGALRVCNTLCCAPSCAATLQTRIIHQRLHAAKVSLIVVGGPPNLSAYYDAERRGGSFATDIRDDTLCIELCD